MFSKKSLGGLLCGVAGLMFSSTALATYFDPPLGSGGQSGYGSYSQFLCPHDEFPESVAAAIDNDDAAFPAGAEGIHFAVNIGCTENDQVNTVCQGGTNLIKTVLDGPAGFTISAASGNPPTQTISRNDGGSFADDGFIPGMTIGVRTPSNFLSSAGDARTLTEVTIASNGVDDGTITVLGNSLLPEGAGVPVAGKIFSSRVNLVNSGPLGCYILPDGVATAPDPYPDPPESPLPADQASTNMGYTKVTRECTEGEGTCTWRALVTDTSSTIQGYTKLDDGKQFINHGCTAGQPCTYCGGSPTKLNSKTLQAYPAEGFFQDLESVYATEDSSASPPLDFHSRFASASPAPGDESICQNATLGFADKGQDRGGNETIEGVLQVAGDFESETFNVAGGGGTVKYTFEPSATEFLCSQIDPSSVRLENASPVPGSELEILGNGTCRAQFYRDEVIANMRAAGEFVDGETRVLVAKGNYNNGAGPTPFESRDTVVITENFNETVGFDTDASCVNEPGGKGTSAPFSVTVEVKGGTPNGIVEADVVDTGNGTARKNDYAFVAQHLIFDPNVQGSLTQQVNVTILGDNNKDPGETIVLRVANVTGPAGLDNVSEHTITIDPTVTDQDGNVSIQQCSGGVPVP
jgi:hypothetical protein